MSHVDLLVEMAVKHGKEAVLAYIRNNPSDPVVITYVKVHEADHASRLAFISVTESTHMLRWFLKSRGEVRVAARDRLRLLEGMQEFHRLGIDSPGSQVLRVLRMYPGHPRGDTFASHPNWCVRKTLARTTKSRDVLTALAEDEVVLVSELAQARLRDFEHILSKYRTPAQNEHLSPDAVFLVKPLQETIAPAPENPPVVRCSTCEGIHPHHFVSCCAVTRVGLFGEGLNMALLHYLGPAAEARIAAMYAARPQKREVVILADLDMED